MKMNELSNQSSHGKVVEAYPYSISLPLSFNLLRSLTKSIICLFFDWLSDKRTEYRHNKFKL